MKGVDKKYLSALPSLKSEVKMLLDEAIERCDNPSRLCEVLGYDPYMVIERIHNPEITLKIEDAIDLGIVSLPLKDF